MRDELARQFVRALQFNVPVVVKRQEEFNFAEPRPVLDYLDSTKFLTATEHAIHDDVDRVATFAFPDFSPLEVHAMQEATFNQSDIVEVTSATVEELKAKAKAAPRGRYRLCLHRSTADQVQEMVIVAPRGTYFRPHRHPAGKTESYHVVEGSMTVFFFNDAGDVIRRIDMAAHGAGKTYLYRLSNRIWHIPGADERLRRLSRSLLRSVRPRRRLRVRVVQSAGRRTGGDREVSRRLDDESSRRCFSRGLGKNPGVAARPRDANRRLFNPPD